ncbi:metal dependent phosphohydrolase [Halovivax asiaticus JCM 14624]|uniref:Metal dependent phosphohydrolase n=1 Tax=Halovivax asiaticus JCM 14624 TaxID=1227490 RepID=M0BT60_9EURY|nr:HD domain-containing protein [Halovivax asiaticus]ELZ14216.1 metal dependent phosphohydrolase [Halovivax asiaticus JCM 14624]
MEADLRAIARSYFEDAAPAHDWQHVRRVHQLATRLAQDRADVDETILRYAVWFHDIGRQREDDGLIDDHAEWGAAEAATILESAGVDPETIDAVGHCIRAHRYSNDVEPESPEATVLCDADNLDALGAVGIARVFSHGGTNGFPMHDPDRPLAADETPGGATSVNHITKKILTLRERMYTDAGRAIAAERHEFVETFLERFEQERSGDA